MSNLIFGYSDTVQTWDTVTQTLSSTFGLPLKSISGSVYAVHTDAAGNIYIGGSFTSVDGVSAKNIAKYDGSQWGPLGTGVGADNNVRSITSSGTDIYIGGYFATVDGVATASAAKWNGSTWSQIGNHAPFANSGGVIKLEVKDGYLYAGGSFIGGGMIYVARFSLSGGTWSALGTPPNVITNFALGNGSDIYAGVQEAGLARWNGTAWSSISGVTNVRGLYFDTGTSLLYIGGYETNIRTWDGSTLSNVGTLTGEMHVITKLSGNIYASGRAISLSASSMLVKWDGAAWSDVTPSGMTSPAEQSGLYVANSKLYVGSNVYVSEFNGTTFTPLVTLPEANNLQGVKRVNGELWAYGGFTSIDSVPANGLAKWTGSAWQAISTPDTSGIYGLEVVGTTVYVISASASSLSRRNENGSWTTLIPSQCHSLRTDGTNLYVGFSGTVGAVTINHIGMWDGTNWTDVGDASWMFVMGFSCAGGKLYANYYVNDNMTFGVREAGVWQALSTTVNGEAYYISGKLFVATQMSELYWYNTGTSAFENTNYTPVQGMLSTAIGNYIYFYASSAGVSVYDAAAMAGYASWIPQPPEVHSIVEEASSPEIPELVTGTVTIEPVGGTIALSQDVTVEATGDLTLNVGELSEITGSGRVIEVKPNGKLQVGNGRKITVSLGTGYLLQVR